MPAHTLKMGLIGAGRIGRLHAEHLTSRITSADLVMVADTFEEVARETAERYGIPLAAQDYRAVLDRPDIQAVVICSSTGTHAQIIEEAARAGKHIFCEKPVALDLPSIDQALAAVEPAGVELLGRAGAISTANNYPNTGIISDARSVRRDLPLYFFVERYAESFVSEMAAFVDAVLQDTPVPVTGYDGRVPVVMALAARKSLIEHRPVRLSEIEQRIY